jgi:hypothetical protein
MDGNPSGLRIIGTTSVELRAGRAYPSAMVKMQQTPMKSGFSRAKGRFLFAVFDAGKLPLMIVANAATSSPKSLILLISAPLGDCTNSAESMTCAEVGQEIVL